MKLGLSSYSLDREIKTNKITLFEAMAWAAQNGAECMELVPFAFSFEREEKIDYPFIKQTKEAAKSTGIELCNYSILANLCIEDDELFNLEIKRVMHHVNIASELELPRMRHDISAFRRPRGENGIKDYDRLLPRMIDAAMQITEYAKTKGVMTLLENHGFFVNGCDRTERLIYGVNHNNYGLLFDTGNITCVDEDAAAAARRLAPITKLIHLKDFYIRKRDPGDTTEFDCSGQWFRSMADKYLRGAILAQGDLDIWEILSQIKQSGYDGHIIIEFEGLEDAFYASKVSMMNARRIWDEV